MPVMPFSAKREPLLLQHPTSSSELQTLALGSVQVSNEQPKLTLARKAMYAVPVGVFLGGCVVAGVGLLTTSALATAIGISVAGIALAAGLLICIVHQVMSLCNKHTLPIPLDIGTPDIAMEDPSQLVISHFNPHHAMNLFQSMRAAQDQKEIARLRPLYDPNTQEPSDTTYQLKKMISQHSGQLLGSYTLDQGLLLDILSASGKAFLTSETVAAYDFFVPPYMPTNQFKTIINSQYQFFFSLLMHDNRDRNKKIVELQSCIPAYLSAFNKIIADNGQYQPEYIVSFIKASSDLLSEIHALRDPSDHSLSLYSRCLKAAANKLALIPSMQEELNKKERFTLLDYKYLDSYIPQGFAKYFQDHALECLIAACKDLNN